MASKAQELVGLTARSGDGDRLGKVTAVIGDAETADGDCLVIKRAPLDRLVVPADVVTRRNGVVMVPFARSFIDGAPKVASEEALSGDERARLDWFFHPDE